MAKEYDKKIHLIKKSYNIFTSPKANHYIVSSINPSDYIRLNSEGFEYTRNNNVVSLFKSDKNYAIDSLNYTMELVNPIVVSKEEYDTVNKFVDQYAKENGLSVKQLSEEVWKFVDGQYDGNVKNFINDFADKKARFTISENAIGEVCAKLNKDNEKYPFTKDEIKQISIEEKTKSILLKGDMDRAEAIIEQLKITDPKEKQIVFDYVEEYFATIDDFKSVEVAFTQEEINNSFTQENIQEFNDFFEK